MNILKVGVLKYMIFLCLILLCGASIENDIDYSLLLSTTKARKSSKASRFIVPFALPVLVSSLSEFIKDIDRIGPEIDLLYSDFLESINSTLDFGEIAEAFEYAIW